MNKNVLSKLTYGLYILSSKDHDKASGCIIDVCVQVATNPDRILISVMDSNYTRELIKKSGVFCIAVLCKDCPFEMIKHFGYQSGRDVDKFEGLTTFTDINGVPSVLSCVCATISAKVVERIDLGSHTVFIGIVKDQKFLSCSEPMTYAHYQEHVKPKVEGLDDHVTQNDEKCVDSPVEADKSGDKYHKDANTLGLYETANKLAMEECCTKERPIVGWKCTICGFVYQDPVLPDDYMCPVCGHPSSDFVPIYG